MYVPGTLENTKSVLVNIGTGYFVEKVSKEMLPSTSHQHVYWNNSFLFLKYILHMYIKLLLD